MTMQFCPASSRFVTRASGITTWHGYSFGAHYDPDRVGFGALVAHNDENLPAGTGYPDHPHSDTEIVSYVMSGALRHSSSVGSRELGPGSVQVLSAGSGVMHSEATEESDTRFIQAWVRPSAPGLVPSYDAAADVNLDGLTCLVGPGALAINAAASMWVAQLSAGESVALPDAPQMHVFAGAGRVMLGEHALNDGDSAHLLDEGGRQLIGDADGSLALVWALYTHDVTALNLEYQGS